MPALRRPPGPKGHFLLGNLPELGTDILGLFASCARDYGDVAFLSLAGWPAYVLSAPKDIEQVLVTDHKNFIKHTFFWRHVRGIFGNGLLTSEGEFWLRQRRLAQPSFHRDRIAAYGDVMTRPLILNGALAKSGTSRSYWTDPTLPPAVSCAATRS